MLIRSKHIRLFINKKEQSVNDVSACKKNMVQPSAKKNVKCMQYRNTDLQRCEPHLYSVVAQERLTSESPKSKKSCCFTPFAVGYKPLSVTVKLTTFNIFCMLNTGYQP